MYIYPMIIVLMALVFAILGFLMMGVNVDQHMTTTLNNSWLENLEAAISHLE